MAIRHPCEGQAHSVCQVLIALKHVVYSLFSGAPMAFPELDESCARLNGAHLHIVRATRVFLFQNFQIALRSGR